MNIDNIDVFSKQSAQTWNEAYKVMLDPEINLFLSEFMNKEGLILDVGCGGGRFLIPVKKKGYDITGIDCSNSMLEVLKNEAIAESIEEISTHNILFSEFKSEETYGSIISLYYIFHILDNNDILKFFSKSFDMLTSDGFIFFNYYNVFEVWNTKGWKKIISNTFRNGFARIEHTYTPIDYVKGISQVENYCIYSNEGETKFEYFVEKIRFYTRTEIEIMLRQIGFNDIKTYMCHNNENICTIARKY